MSELVIVALRQPRVSCPHCKVMVGAPTINGVFDVRCPNCNGRFRLELLPKVETFEESDEGKLFGKEG